MACFLKQLLNLSNVPILYKSSVESLSCKWLSQMMRKFVLKFLEHTRDAQVWAQLKDMT